MRRIDDTFPVLRFVPALILVVILGIAMELSGAWITMLVAGAIGALFVRKTLHAFLVGFLGTAIAWGLIFAYLILNAYALEIADFFLGLLGLSGMGALAIAISILIGGFLGGFGGVLGRSTIELIDGITSKSGSPEPASSPNSDTKP